MPEIPDCLARRYRALDELIRELTSNKSGSNIDCCSDDPGVKMMCNFWNILKENPDCDLKVMLLNIRYQLLYFLFLLLNTTKPTQNYNL